MIMRIKELREAAGMTAKAGGRYHGSIDLGSVQLGKRGGPAQGPSAPLLAQVLGCSIDALFLPVEDAS